jgi:hypothetical protein
MSRVSGGKGMIFRVRGGEEDYHRHRQTPSDVLVGDGVVAREKGGDQQQQP